MTVIPSNQYTQFWKSLPVNERTLIQGYFGKVGNDFRNLTIQVETMDGQGGSGLFPETPPYAIRLTAAEIRGEALCYPDASSPDAWTISSSLELQNLAAR